MIHIRQATLSPFLTLLPLLFLFLLSGCGPDVPEQVSPTKKTPQCQEIPKAPPTTIVVNKLAPPEPLADPELAADPKLLRVGFLNENPPFIFQKDKEIHGLEEELAQQFGAFAGKKVAFVKVPEKRATEALVNGNIDIIMSGKKIIGNEDCALAFSEPYLRSGQILLVRSQNSALFSTGIYSLENSKFTFGVVQGSTGDQFLTKTIHGIKILRFQNAKSAVIALTQKKIDLFLHDAPTVCHYAAASKLASLTPILTLITEEQIGWEMRKEDEKLRQLANQFIQHSKADGQLQKTIKKWIPNL